MQTMSPLGFHNNIPFQHEDAGSGGGPVFSIFSVVAEHGASAFDLDCCELHAAHSLPFREY